MLRFQPTTKKIAAATAAIAVGFAALPPLARNVTTAVITATVSADTGLSARCETSPDTPHGWFDFAAPRDCTVDADVIPMYRTVSECGGGTHNAIAYTTNLYGHSVIVFSNTANEAVRRHERAHRNQPRPSFDSVVDHVVYDAFLESDARISVIVSAYQDLLARGDGTVWEQMNRSDPTMVRVFDALLQVDPESREALARDEWPSTLIMNRTAMAYLFSSVGQSYLVNDYARSYPGSLAALAEGAPMTLTPGRLAELLPQGGKHYLFDPGAGRTNNPLNRWVLYRTLGYGFGVNEQQMVRAEGVGPQALSNSNAQLLGSNRCPTVRAQAAANGDTPPPLDPRIEGLAYRAAGLESFMGQLDDGPLTEPLAGIRLPSRSVASTNAAHPGAQP